MFFAWRSYNGSLRKERKEGGGEEESLRVRMAGGKLRKPGELMAGLGKWEEGQEWAINLIFFMAKPCREVGGGHGEVRTKGGGKVV